jgi:hypothetical protein
MARKKKASPRSASAAVAATPTAPTPVPTPAPELAMAARKPQQPAEEFWLEPVLKRFSKYLGSLQVAVVLLLTYAAVLALGTVVESWYNGRVAQQLIYRTWWFHLLMGLLFINILCAAAKKADAQKFKLVAWQFAAFMALVTTAIFAFFAYSGTAQGYTQYALGVTALGLAVAYRWTAEQARFLYDNWPWKRHQTGFLITHLGLLTLIVGGILNSVAGTDAQMLLVDTDRRDYPQYGDYVAKTAIDPDRAALVFRVGKEDYTFDFPSGSLAWHEEEGFKPQYHWLTHSLDFLAHPLPKSWSASLPGGGRVEVLNYYPHTRREPIRVAKPNDRDTFPAVKIELKTPQGMDFSEWLVGTHHRERDISREIEQGPAFIEYLGGEAAAAQVKEFLNPPASTDLGAKGTLVVFLDNQRYAFNVAQVVAGGRQALGESGWGLEVLRYTPDARDADKADGPPSYPAVQFGVTNPSGERGAYHVTARDPEPLKFDAEKPATKTEFQGRLKFWYHPPDYRYGAPPPATKGHDQKRGILQFLTDGAGKLYYRAFHFDAVAGAAVKESSGPVAADGTRYPIWQKMNWEFAVADGQYFPRAAKGEVYIPVNRRPGLERSEKETLQPAVRLKVTLKGEEKEVVVPHTREGFFTSTTVSGDKVQVGFFSRKYEFPFSIRLLRAEQTQELGSTSTYTSYVQLIDANAGIKDEDHVITMNEPLEYHGYKFYQSGLNPIPDRQSERPVNQSILTVGHDPGLGLKYAGSLMLALGIVCMFYMKAYFLTGKKRPAPADLPPAQPSGA